MDQNIPILVVNLTRSKERRVYMQEQLDAFGVRYEFYPAVDGNALTPQQRACYSEEESVRQFGYPLTNGEIGCALSHLQICEKMVAEDIAELLILEDDAAIKKDFFPLIFQRAQWAPANWRILHFSTEDIRLNTFPCYFIDTQKRYRLYRYTDIYNGTFCYIINNETARWLIKKGYPIHFPADKLMGKNNNVLPAYTVAPRICGHSYDETSSVIAMDLAIMKRRSLSNIHKQKKALIRRRRTYLVRKLAKKVIYLLSAHYSSYRKIRHFLKDIRNAPILLRNMVRRFCMAPLLIWRWKRKKIRIED